MKKFIGITFLIVIVMAIAWSFYLDHEAKTYGKKSLKAPIEAKPAEVLTDIEAPTPTDQNDPNIVAQTSKEVLEDRKTVEQFPSSDNPTLNENTETQQSHNRETNDWRTNGALNTPPRKTNPWQQTNPQDLNENATHFSQMSPDERADHLRDSWLKMFGDIPEVHAASEYLRKIMKNQHPTIDEMITGLEASHKLFPKSGFNMQLEHYKSMRENGTPILYPEEIDIVE